MYFLLTDKGNERDKSYSRVDTTAVEHRIKTMCNTEESAIAT